MERRYKIGVLEQATLTDKSMVPPDVAAKMADLIQQVFLQVPDRLLIESIEPGEPESLTNFKTMLIDSIGPQFETARITVWRAEIWKAAITGAEVFVDVPVEKPFWNVDRMEVWFPPTAGILLKDPEMCRELNVEPGSAYWELLMLVPAHITEDVPGVLLENQKILGHSLTPVVLLVRTTDAAPFIRVLGSVGWHDPANLIATAQRFGGERFGLHNGAGAIMRAGLEFLRQPFISHAPLRAARAERRRAQRSGKTLKTVYTVALRRAERRGTPAQDIDHGHIEWSCQWLVGGHWRNQWYPSEGKHRPKYIMPYLKGPDGKPLKERTRTIYEARR